MENQITSHKPDNFQDVSCFFDKTRICLLFTEVTATEQISMSSWQENEILNLIPK